MNGITQEYKKAIMNGGIWLTAMGVFLVNYLNLLDEIRYTSGTSSSSVFYFWINRDGLGAFSIMITLFVCFPFAIEYSIEHYYGSWKYYIVREGIKSYIYNKVIVTVSSTIFAYFLGYLLLWICLRLSFPAFPVDNEENNLIMLQSLETMPFKSLAMSRRAIYFVVSLLPEIFSYAFLAVFSLFISGYTDNKYLIAISPIVLFYGWNYLTGLLDLPSVFMWPLKRMTGFTVSENDFSNICFTFTYYMILIMLFSLIWGKHIKQELENA